jgi:hypothetical protein
MANRAKYPAQSFGIGREYAEVQLQLNGAAAPTVLEGKEFIKSATHAGGTNVIAVTLFDAFPKVVAHAVDVRDDAGNGAYATIGNFANEASQASPALPITFSVRTFTAGGAASNDSALVIVITLAMRNSNVTAGN